MASRERRGYGSKASQNGRPARNSPTVALITPPAVSSTPHVGGHVTTVGIKRPGFGSMGHALPVHVNAFQVTIPVAIIHHYDVISPSQNILPARLNMGIIQHLQANIHSDVFTPRAVYDGRKNLYAIRQLPDFTKDEDSEKETREAYFAPTELPDVFSIDLQFVVPLSVPGVATQGKTYKVRLTKVAEINPETLHRYVQGEQSHDNSVLTATTALNVVIRNEPSLKYPFNARSFYTDQETSNIGSGLALWRGYFQSVRPGIGKMLINIDISTGTMYKAGPLINLCLSFLNKEGQTPQMLAPKHGLPDRIRLQLQRFISGVRIVMVRADGKKFTRIIKKLSATGASGILFSLRDGDMMTVAQYFEKTYNRPLKYPDVICAEVGSQAMIPLELCEVPPGQIIRKQIPSNKTKDVLAFATRRPSERLASIRRGLRVLAYSQSDYVRHFGIHVNDETPLRIQARVLPPPKLKYGVGSKQLTVVPRDGAWNMIEKRFFRPAAPILSWGVIVFEREARFSVKNAEDMIDGLVKACTDVGIQIQPTSIIEYVNAQGRIHDHLLYFGGKCRNKYGRLPTFIVAVIPEGGDDIYVAIKHFGDISVGVATQCLKSSKCYRAKPQYYANVCLKINVKLGGINLIPEQQSVSVLADPRFPTVIMGADVLHPAPGAEGRPSFTALVGNTDSDTAKYIAVSRVQTSRREMIDDLQDMAMTVIKKYMSYRRDVERLSLNVLPPKRIIFYRDGVSEGQFGQVLGEELPRLQAACRALNMHPKITIVIVGKRHHLRFFPVNKDDARRSGNCPAGTVVDQEVAHPTDFDFYLQSHSGLLGTSRPAHYSVLYDENNFTADGLQALTFALCHVYSRATRSVSIPAPVYYADIVAARSKNHYDPQNKDISLSENSQTSDLGSFTAQSQLDHYKQHFKPLHANQANLMYFS